MRTLTTAQEAVLDHRDREAHFKVEIENGSGTFINMRALADRDWYRGGSWDDETSHPVPEITLRFLREDGQGRSLSPLIEESPLNVDDAGAFAPLIDAGREVKAYQATLLPGNLPADGDWELVFHGEIDDWDAAKGPDVEIIARDKIGAHLVDRWIENETEYGSAAGVAMETVMQSIITDWTDAGITLYSANGTAGTPFDPADSPGFLVTTTPFGGISVMDALERIAQLIGWAVRPRWNESVGAFVLTLYEPDRAKVTPDRTFGPSDYMEPTRLRASREDVRNVVEVEYTDSATGARATVDATDPTSIADFGRRWMRLIEADDSPIDTAAEAQAMADAALADLKDVEAEFEVPMPFFWPAQREDLYRFTGANGVHFDTDQDWAVTGITHDLDPENPITRIRVRGSPAGMYRQWHGRELGDVEDPFVPTVRPTKFQVGAVGTLVVEFADPQSRVQSVRFKKHAGRGDFDFSDPTDGTWTIDGTAPYVETVDLQPKHPSRIAWAVGYTAEDGTVQYLTGVEEFDLDLIAEITSLTAHVNGNGVVVVEPVGDEDAANRYVTVGLGSPPSDPTAGANDGSASGRSSAIVTASSPSDGQQVYVKAVAADSGGTLGPVQSFNFLAYKRATISRVDQIDRGAQNLLPMEAEDEASAAAAEVKALGVTLAVMKLEEQETISLRGQGKADAAGRRVALSVVFQDSVGATISDVTGTTVTGTAYGWSVIQDVQIPVGTVTIRISMLRLDTGTISARRYRLNRGPLASPYEDPPYRKREPLEKVDSATYHGYVPKRFYKATTAVTVDAERVIDRDNNDAGDLDYDSPGSGTTLQSLKPAIVGAEPRPPTILSVSLSVFDDGVDNTYTANWTISAATTSAYQVRVTYYEGGVQKGQQTSTATDLTDEFVDTGGGDGASDSHNAVFELLQDGNVIQTITGKAVASGA